MTNQIISNQRKLPDFMPEPICSTWDVTASQAARVRDLKLSRFKPTKNLYLLTPYKQKGIQSFKQKPLRAKMNSLNHLTYNTFANEKIYFTRKTTGCMVVDCTFSHVTFSRKTPFNDIIFQQTYYAEEIFCRTKPVIVSFSST